MTLPERHLCVSRNSVPNSIPVVQFQWLPWELCTIMAVICVEVTAGMCVNKWSPRA